jgi:hypothetical protein
MNRKLDTSLNSLDPATVIARVDFDDHLNDCARCQPGLCPKAEPLWRAVCLAALKAHAGSKAHF